MMYFSGLVSLDRVLYGFDETVWEDNCVACSFAKMLIAIEAKKYKNQTDSDMHVLCSICLDNHLHLCCSNLCHFVFYILYFQGGEDSFYYFCNQCPLRPLFCLFAHRKLVCNECVFPSVYLYILLRSVFSHLAARNTFKQNNVSISVFILCLFVQSIPVQKLFCNLALNL